MRHNSCWSPASRHRNIWFSLFILYSSVFSLHITSHFHSTFLNCTNSTFFHLNINVEIQFELLFNFDHTVYVRFDLISKVSSAIVKNQSQIGPLTRTITLMLKKKFSKKRPDVNPIKLKILLNYIKLIFL